MSSESLRPTVISEIGRLAHELMGGEELSAFLDYVADFYPLQTPDDLLEMPAATLLEIAKRAWDLGEDRAPGTPLVELVPAQEKGDHWSNKYLALVIINDDMPFLVDSITGGLASAMQLRIHMMHHPILKTRRDAAGHRVYGENAGDIVHESLMFIEIDPQTDPDIRAEIEAGIRTILGDVRAAVKDWRGMLAKIDETVASLTVNPPPMPQEEVDETILFLRWLAQDHFTFLGFREYRFDGDPASFDFDKDVREGLGVLRDPARLVLKDRDGLTSMSREIRHFLSEEHPLVITKANVRATVHRQNHMDYIGVKIYDAEGTAVGERRFVGLFTSLSYNKFCHDVPILRHKVTRVQERTHFENKSHAGKALAHILETFPRDELFQVSEDWLYETAIGILQLTERPRPRVFLRPDPFERFVSAIVYVPRDIYNSALRQAISDILCDAYKGEVSVYYANLTQESLARWHFIIRTRPGDVGHPDAAEINALVAEAALGWTDRLHSELTARYGYEEGNRLNHAYRRVFNQSYRESFTPPQAAYDIAKLEELSGAVDLRVDFYRHLADGADRFRLKLYHGRSMVPLSESMPVLERLGFRCLLEHPYKMDNGKGSHIHDFLLERAGISQDDFPDIKPVVEGLICNVWRGRAENDAFNELALVAALDWQGILVLRAYGKYLRQLGLSYSADYMATTLVVHHSIARALVALFTAQFDPKGAARGRDARVKTIEDGIAEALEGVSSLDEDRILRGYIHVIRATLRTNFYQPGVLEGADERGLAFKIRTRNVEEAPLPRPHAEIWVYSPRVEGVHLRGGPVARGGLRWSDRPEDFRTEVLGLVKAQQVKNAVIVPQGSKGGFYPKRLPKSGGRDAFIQEGIASYRIFITSLLSITDNLKAGKVVAPQDTVRRDDDDPYLVVAADKGTATFSDIANGISDDHGFWLSDAFASGGKNGYDHKKMGITARGAWVCVQRHFRELGVNTQTDPVSVIGVGDMSGDVFGNGMLLSKTIALKAAFNHLHIFIDPKPKNLEAHWDERQRLFTMERSTWDDYDKALISKGGGVFSRAEKAIKLSKEMKAWLEVEADTLTPNQLIHHIMKAEADLLWFGGIGTYVRSTEESDSEVGDRANDALRVTDRDLRVKVVGEGGNLGMTQRSRIAFAARGGRLNTDFIDNSAGVDCSDKEVNIKILLADAVESGRLDRAARDTLLEQMTDEVAEIVLSDNYLQTQAISLAENKSAAALPYHQGLIRALERDGDLDREVETLPSDEGFSELAASDRGLTRPEIATLMAYAKMSLFDILIKGTLIDDPVLRPELEWGFPTALRKTYPDELSRHRLKREIIATVLANEVVNWGGLTFVFEIKEETGLAVEDIVAAFVTVREVYGLKGRWDAINALDNQVPAAIQYDMHQSLSDSLKEQVLWMLRNLPQPFKVSDLVERFTNPFKKLFDIDAEILSVPTRAYFTERRAWFTGAGVPVDLATFVAGFEVLRQGADIIWVAEETGKSVDKVAEVHFALGDMFGFDWLRTQADRVTTNDHWEVLSIRSELEEVTDQQRALVLNVCQAAGKGAASKALKDWQEKQKTRIIRAERLMEDLRASGGLTVAKLSFATRHLRSIMR